eukprot:4833317-Pleurochrysis_carterae.AAC.1
MSSSDALRNCCVPPTPPVPSSSSSTLLIAAPSRHQFSCTSVTRQSADCFASLITFPQCALGAPTQKFTSLLVSPALAPALQSLSDLRCQHHPHTQIAGGSKSDLGWTSRAHAAYPPDFNFLIAK